MKIVIDARELRASTGRYVERLLHYLQAIDHANHYDVLLYPRDFDSWQPSNPNFSKVRCPHKEFTFDEQIGMLKLVKSLNADLVHFAMTQQPVRYRGKVVTTIHDLTTARFRNPTKNWWVFTIKQQVYKWVIKRVARKSKHIITVSNFVKQDIIAFTGISSQKITVTYEAADPIQDTPQPVADLENVPFIMYVGRPTPHKNLERLVQAFAKLKVKHPDLRLVLVGKKDANYQRLETSVRHQSIEGVMFTDFVSEGQLRWLYEHTRAYVFPSLSEGFGLPPLEAMWHGAPVISSNATALPEIYKDAATYFDPLDISAMSLQLDHVLTNEAVRQELIKKGQRLVKEYSWERTAQQTLEVYNQLLRSN